LTIAAAQIEALTPLENRISSEVDMRLYEFAPTRSIRVRWTLQEIGIPFESVSIDMRRDEHRRPEFLKINPAAKLPVLVDGDSVLTESIAIVLYLAEKHPEKQLLPVSPDERAQAYRWLLFAATELEQPLWRISKHTAIYPEDRRLVADIALAREDFAPMARVLANHMAERAYVVGHAVTVADFVLAYTLDWANEAQMLADLPCLRDYVERMYQRPHAPPRIAAAFAGLDLR
jgi:glutathione S-transferase